MRKTIKDLPDYNRVKKYVEYWQFVDWMATPTPLRKEKSQEAWAKAHSMHYNQCGRWKAMPEFRRDLVQRVGEVMGDDLSDVMYSLRNKIFKEGNAAEVSLFLKWATGWVEKLRFENDDSAEVDKMLDKGESLIEEFDKRLKELKTTKK